MCFTWYNDKMGKIKTSFKNVVYWDSSRLFKALCALEANENTEEWNKKQTRELYIPASKLRRPILGKSPPTTTVPLIERASLRYFELLWPWTNLPLNWRKHENNTLDNLRSGVPLFSRRESTLIQLLDYLSVASPESGLFSDWSRNTKYLELSHSWFPLCQS